MTYNRDPDVVKRSVAGEVFLIPIRANLADLQNVYVLHGTGEFIWDRLDGEASLDAVVESLTGEYDVEAGEARKDVQELIGELVRVGLVKEIG